jgi:RimJ/RimL family protein N-acetyltransferase
MLKMWNPRSFSPSLVREARSLIDYIVEAFGLVRVGTVTADPRIARMAKMVGFETEGVRRKAFSWDGKTYDEILLSRVREGG